MKHRIPVELKSIVGDAWHNWKQGIEQMLAHMCAQPQHSKVPGSGLTLVSVGGWTDVVGWMTNAVCVDSRMSFHLKEEGNSDPCYHRDEPWLKCTSHKSSDAYGVYLYEVPRLVRFIEMESTMVVFVTVSQTEWVGR